MMYQEKFVAVVKVAGKILREIGDVVTLPFGTEYSILLKNLDSIRLKVKVSIDGQSATGDTWLVIDPNSSLELERFIKNSNFTSGNRLKFIERTETIENHRGIQVEDGLIRIEYKKEHVEHVETITVNHNHYNDWHYTNPYYPWGYGKWPYTTYCNSQTGQNVQSTLIRSTGLSGGNFIGSMQVTNCSNLASAGATLDFNDAGITVPGSLSEQQFTPVSDFKTVEYSNVLVIRLRGKVGEKSATRPITVTYRPVCTTCGKTNSISSKFCFECGTTLTIV